MTTPGAQTKARILAAGRAEFASFGFAGARIDRIADAASVNKERIYAHVGDKQVLFAAVVAANSAELYRTIALDAADLPGSAGRIFDHLTAQPENLRILDWARLEGLDEIAATFDLRHPDRAALLDSIAQSQRAGLVRADVSPNDVLVSIFAIATAWMHAPRHLVEAQVSPEGARRALVVESVRRIVAP
ncbi:TetR family transcriptional regulator [Pengzhenrongella sicca]|uniref:TetR family transcriptional regulator n=1 Tax=Pengzhenrongella sicca TaxID=2819238 RepID=A0A8A4Z960_9MICO|nr:TetR family transcriptional regulator [Pengzhenrongella sicca]QTE27961.1 TetR family transcriptional regulator [Pengzhenrongella sicca]